MPGIVAGHADDGVVSDDLAGLGAGHVLLADVDAVAAGLGGEPGVVVEQEGHAAVLRHGPQTIDGAPQLRVADALQAELHGGHVAGFERRREQRGERLRFPRLGRDQVASAARGDGGAPLQSLPL